MSHMIHKTDNYTFPVSPARRHFMGIVAAGAGRLSTIAVSSALLAGCNPDAQGTQSSPDDKDVPSHHCFGRATLIRTAHGEVPIEDLTHGALVMTTKGVLPVKWVGRRTLTRNPTRSWHPSVVPIRVERLAIDDLTPQRDLYLSQEHSLLVDGVLIPVKHLVNGSSIAFDHHAAMSETIEYFCVEFDSHEVIFAEGTAAESFRYSGGQIAWDNLREYQELYGMEHKVMSEFAPIFRYNGGRAELRGLLRLAASRFIDVRDPIQIAYDRIAARAIALAA